MPEARQVLVRADGGAGIGAGHLVRSWSLARALEDSGCNVRFACNPESRAMLAELGIELQGWIDTAAAGTAEKLGASSGGCDLLTIDHYGLGRDYEERSRRWAASILVIDDAPSRPHDCDVLLDQTCGRSPNEYHQLVPASCRILAGTEYALLRPGFATARIKASSGNQPALRVFVAFGATDASRMMIPCLESLRGADGSIDIDAVIHSSAPHLEEVRAAATRLRATLHIDADDVASLMGRADIAVLAAGSIVWEACCMGVLPLLLVAADNQKGVAAALVARDAAVVCDRPESVGRVLVEIVADPARAAGLRTRAAALCDGLGARRAAIVLVPEQDRDGRPVTLRPAGMDDAALILEWQSAPETRRYARNPAVPSAAAHLAWMDAALRRKDCIFNIILIAGQPAGVLRMERHKETAGCFEVSIFVAPGDHGRGIGKAALRLARRLLPDAELFAHVLPENMASRSLFLGAGFVSDSDWYRSVPQAGRA